MANYRCILFDLDGTLTDSAPGIVNSVQYALKKNGMDEPDREKLLDFVGPPLTDSFMKHYGMSRKEAEHMVEDYREYFRVRGWKENSVYDGVRQMLETLKCRGKKLVVATSKPEKFARQILAYFKLDTYFDYIGGSTMDGRISGKDQVISCVLDQIGLENKDQAVMVGDREHDVIGARANGLPCIGVLYGYGSREELEAAGALAICPDTEQLPDYVS